MIDWAATDRVTTGPGRPILRSRLIAGLLYLQHAFNLSAVQIWKSGGQRRGGTRGLKAMIKRQSAIEPTIGHMKNDGKLGRNWLKGPLGDAMHAVLCGAGQNIRLIINKLKCCGTVVQVY